MDGFNVIPVEKNSPKDIAVAASAINSPSIEIATDDKKATKNSASSSLFFLLSILALLGVILYFGYLVWYRYYMLGQIVYYGEQMTTISKNIDKKEMENFRSIDKVLKTINSKLGKHVLNSQILIFVNNNIRNSLQVTEYLVNVKAEDVEVSVTAIAPTFKDFAEQTEKLFALKEASSIKSFSISNLSFEQDTKRLRFTTRLVFDRSKVSALASYTNTQ